MNRPEASSSGAQVTDGAANIYLERGFEQVTAVNSAGERLFSGRRLDGMAVRSTGAGDSFFVQRSGVGAGHVRALLSDVAEVAAGLPINYLEAALVSASQLVEGLAPTIATKHDVVGELLAAAREGALSCGARNAEARLWHQERCYVSGPDISGAAGPALRQNVGMRRLTVSAGIGAQRGTVTIAELAHLPLTVERAAEAGRRAAERVANLAVATAPSRARAAVVLAPEAAGVFAHEVIGHALEADTAVSSSLWRQRGQSVSHPDLTVRDDGTDPWAWERVASDEEGTPCTVAADLIVGGAVEGVLTDRANAARLGVRASGHARRGAYTNPPVPRMRHLTVERGPESPQEIIRDTADGILVLEVGSSDAVPAEGRFMIRVVEAREIVNGEIGRPLTGFTVHGGLAELATLDAVGNDAAGSVSMCGRQGRWLPVSHRAPTLRLGHLGIRGKGVPA
ncbi:MULTISPECIES: TldD/PmbA family protein [Kitasatospora]|uniref:Metalloprotease TldD/E C-terminal domain-containing protein n=1 Tax=Kitasatospora cystarginea TaxID=58350 RepID=A0ABN3DK26_9ACTN